MVPPPGEVCFFVMEKYTSAPQQGGNNSSVWFYIFSLRTILTC
jgi:hypothetical protein